MCLYGVLTRMCERIRMKSMSSMDLPIKSELLINNALRKRGYTQTRYLSHTRCWNDEIASYLTLPSY